MSEPSSQDNPVFNLTTVHVVARCIHVIADAGVADALDEEPRPAAELAAATGLNADALGRILRLLSTYGLFARHGSGYVHTSGSRLLRTDHPVSMRSFARMIGTPMNWDHLTEFRHAAVTGRPKRDFAGAMAYFATHPEEAQIFNRAMIDVSGPMGPAIAGAYDFSRFGTIVDVGGGLGHLARAIVDRYPTVEGVCFDVPHVVADAEVSGKASTRLRFHGGDFFSDPLPIADAYVIKQVIHDWDDEDAMRILTSIHRAAPATAKVLLVEQIAPEPDDVSGPHPAILLDVMMLAATGGRERTASEYAALLDASGFRVEKVIRTPTLCSIVEAAVA